MFKVQTTSYFHYEAMFSREAMPNRMKKNQTWRPSTSLKLHAWFPLLPGTTKGGGTRWHVWTVFLADMFTLQWYGGHIDILSEQFFGSLFCSWLPDLSLIINNQFSWFKKLSGRTIIFSLFNISTICHATVMLKVSWFWILPKNEWKDLTYSTMIDASGWLVFIHFFGRIEDTRKFFRN